MTQPPARPLPLRKSWPTALLVLGILATLIGGGVATIEANNHAICTGALGAAGGQQCVGYNVAHELGRLLFDVGLVLLLGSIIGFATDFGRQRWQPR